MDVKITLSAADLARIVEALDCYEYWELGQRLPRNDGTVFLPGDFLGNDDPYWREPPTEEESEAIEVVRASRALGERIQAPIQ